MKINIGFNKYDLIKSNNNDISLLLGSDGEEEVSIGLTDELEKKIWISKEIPKQSIMSVFMHEIVHALLFETGDAELSYDERLVEALGKQILYFLQHNDLKKIENYLTT